MAPFACLHKSHINLWISERLTLALSRCPTSHCCVQAKEVFQALDIFRDMQARGYRPNMTTWCALISSFNKSRKRGWPYAQAAHDLWTELRMQGSDTLKDIDAPSFAVGELPC